MLHKPNIFNVFGVFLYVPLGPSGDPLGRLSGSLWWATCCKNLVFPMFLLVFLYLGSILGRGLLAIPFSSLGGALAVIMFPRCLSRGSLGGPLVGPLLKTLIFSMFLLVFFIHWVREGAPLKNTKTSMSTSICKNQGQSDFEGGQMLQKLNIFNVFGVFLYVPLGPSGDPLGSPWGSLWWATC